MSQKNWYPEQLYRAALIITMVTHKYTWEDVGQYTRMEYREVWDIWWHYRRTRLTPYAKLTPIHREMIQLLGRAGLAYFEELSCSWLNYPKRKMVVLPHGIYTVIYKHKRRRRKLGKTVETMEAMLQKCRHINGRSVIRGVSLGKVGSITKERLLKSSYKLERKLKGLQPLSA